MRNNFVLFLFVVLLGGCVSAQFPELEEPKNEVIESDSKNAVYENIEAQPTKPVAVEETSEKNKEVVESKAEKKEEIITQAKSVEVIEEPVDKTKKTGPAIELLKETIYFADGASSVSRHNKHIRSAAKFIKDNNAKVKVVGHSSSRTLNTDPVSHKIANFNASLSRAQNVAKALIAAGVNKDEIIVEALSDSQPAYKEVMQEGERLNRRAEIYVIY